MIQRFKTSLLILVTAMLSAGPTTMCWCGPAVASDDISTDYATTRACHVGNVTSDCHSVDFAQEQSCPSENQEEKQPCSGCAYCSQIVLAHTTVKIDLSSGDSIANVIHFADHVSYSSFSSHASRDRLNTAPLPLRFCRGDSLREMNCLLII